MKLKDYRLNPGKYSATARTWLEQQAMEAGLPMPDTKTNALKTFTEIFSEWIMDTAIKESKLCAITPAMSDGSGLNEFS